MKPGFSTADYSAIGWYCKSNKLIPQLSIPPIVYFTDKNGKEIRKHVKSINIEYIEWKRQQRRDELRAKQSKKHQSRIDINRKRDEAKDN